MTAARGRPESGDKQASAELGRVETDEVTVASAHRPEARSSRRPAVGSCQ